MRWIALLLLSGVLLTAAACGDDDAAEVWKDEVPKKKASTVRARAKS